tara:strand:- start:716 stop:1036 length:321 start_codon:yes stop_codon:yes gene_type:complete
MRKKQIIDRLGSLQTQVISLSCELRQTRDLADATNEKLAGILGMMGACQGDLAKSIYEYEEEVRLKNVKIKVDFFDSRTNEGLESLSFEGFSDYVKRKSLAIEDEF